MANQNIPTVEAVKDYVKENVAIWDSSKEYAIDDLAIDSGNIYKSLVGSNINNQPSTDTDNLYWELIEKEYTDSTVLALAIALG